MVADWGHKENKDLPRQERSAMKKRRRGLEREPESKEKKKNGGGERKVDGEAVVKGLGRRGERDRRAS